MSHDAQSLLLKGDEEQVPYSLCFVPREGPLSSPIFKVVTYFRYCLHKRPIRIHIVSVAFTLVNSLNKDKILSVRCVTSDSKLFSQYVIFIRLMACSRYYARWSCCDFSFISPLLYLMVVFWRMTKIHDK